MVIDFIIISLLFLIFSAFFSAAETSLTGASKAFLLSQENQGSKRALLANKLLKNFDTLIISLLIGNNISNILFTTYVTVVTVNIFGSEHITLLGLGITCVVLIFAENLPKTYAFNDANKMALRFAPMVYAVVLGLKPLAFIFLNINKILYKILKPTSNKSSNNIFASVDSLRGAIEMFEREEESKSLLKEEKAMLHSILDLNELLVSDILNHRKNVFCIDVNEDNDKIIDILVNCAYTRIPVFKDKPDNIIGILNVKEVFKAYRENPEKVNVSKLMKAPYFTPESTYVIDLLMRFRDKQERMAVIVDEYGSFMGILTLGDILEEITGELKNTEQENNNDEIHSHQDSLITSGDLKIRDLNRKMNLKFPDNDFTTVAGLILYETGKIPNVGNIFVFYGFRFEILEKKRHQLTKIKITPIDLIK